jgi:hypothetical protein
VVQDREFLGGLGPHALVAKVIGKYEGLLCGRSPQLCPTKVNVDATFLQSLSLPRVEIAHLRWSGHP